MDRQSAHAVFGSEPCPPGACFHVGALSLVAGGRVTRTVSSAHDDPALLQRSFFTHTSFSTECNSTGAIRTPNGNAVSRGTEASRFLKRCSGRTKRPKSASACARAQPLRPKTLLLQFASKLEQPDLARRAAITDGTSGMGRDPATFQRHRKQNTHLMAVTQGQAPHRELCRRHSSTSPYLGALHVLQPSQLSGTGPRYTRVHNSNVCQPCMGPGWTANFTLL